MCPWWHGGIEMPVECDKTKGQEGEGKRASDKWKRGCCYN